MNEKLSYQVTVNGVAFDVDADRDANLLSLLRDQVGLTGTKQGCDDCECGACMVLVDGRPVNSCSYLAVQTGGRDVTTIEGLAEDDELHPIQQAMLDHAGVQCGFCTPGMIMSAHALLETTPKPSIEEIRIGLSGNLCRCTGYQSILNAIGSAANAED